MNLFGIESLALATFQPRLFPCLNFHEMIPPSNTVSTQLKKTMNSFEGNNFNSRGVTAIAVALATIQYELAIAIISDKLKR